MALMGYLLDGIRVAAIMGLSDTMAQLYLDGKQLNEWDTARTLKFSALGLVFVGPLMRRWYMFLESKVPKEQSVVRRGISKMLLDQVVFTPPYTLVMSGLVPLINGESTEEIMRRIRYNYFTIFGLSCMLWPAAQLFNFTYVPLSYQVPFVQSIAVIWDCYISEVLNKKQDQ